MRWSKSLPSQTRHGLAFLGAGLALAALTFVPARSEEGVAPPIYKKHYAMGTVYEIVAYGASSQRTSAAIDKAFEEIDRLDQVMSDFKPDSDLSRLNRSAHFHPQPVCPDLYQVIQDSLRYSELSEGAFDITVGPLANRWKAVGRGEPVPGPAEVEKLRSCVGYRMVELIPPNQIEFHSPCLKVELGAIGKGYAVDRAVAVLRSFGIERALVNGGGSSLYGMGTPPGQPGWLVHLRDPSRRVDPSVLLRDNSVSTSQQTPPTLVGGISYGHIIDPATGLPSKMTFAASAVAETGTATDGLSLTLFMLGPVKGKALVEKLPKTAGVWVSPEGQVATVSTGPKILLRRPNESGR